MADRLALFLTTIDGNQLEVVPTEIGNLESLRQLDLGKFPKLFFETIELTSVAPLRYLTL